jgi:hypothetical protein
LAESNPKKALSGTVLDIDAFLQSGRRCPIREPKLGIPLALTKAGNLTTDAQIAANRRNAESSTGPRTDEGKNVSKHNALKHGFTGSVAVLPTEDPKDYARFRDSLLESLAPVGSLEERLAEEIVEGSWRLRRAAKIEFGVLVSGVADADERFLGSRRRMLETTNHDVTTASLEAAGISAPDKVIEVTNPELHEYLEGVIDEVVGARRTEEARLAQAFIDDAAGPNAVAKLGRHETAIFRRRNQALATLTSIQGERYAKADERSQNASGEVIT